MLIINSFKISLHDICMIILKNVDLSKFSNFSIGGKANCLIKIKKEREINDFFNFIKKKKMKYFVLGNGTNTIFDDTGYNGIIVKLETDYLNFLDQYTVEVSAGMNLSKFILTCLENNLKGYEKMLGIPGTVGGAIRGNSGAQGQEIQDNLISVKIYHDGVLKTYYKKECEFSYRMSIFKRMNNFIISSAKFQLKSGDKQYLLKKANKIITERNKKFPIQFPNIGCFFKNPIISRENLPKNISKNAVQNYDSEKIKISGSWLIENVGLKGYKLNDVGVSNKHALFLVNYGNAKFSDVINLMNLIKDKVYKKFSICLEPEVELLYNKS